MEKYILEKRWKTKVENEKFSKLNINPIQIDK